MKHHPSTLVLLLVGALTVGCASSTDGSSGTTGRAITLKTKLDIKDNLKKSKTNSLGWAVTISKAYLSVGALYYYSGDPVLSQRPAFSGTNRSALAWLGDLLIKPAYAHPGHYIEGAAMGQMLEATTVDLLEGSLDLADGDGVTGLTNSARFTWQSPAKGELAPSLKGHVILTQGTATKDGVTLQFIAKADDTEVVDGDKKAEVAGCAFGSKPGDVGVDMDGDGTVTLTLVPSVWFDQVDFAYVAPGATDAPKPDANGVVDIAGTLAWQGFIRGVKKGTAYEFSYTK
jgi:hypothetical protein